MLRPPRTVPVAFFHGFVEAAEAAARRDTKEAQTKVETEALWRGAGWPRVAQGVLMRRLCDLPCCLRVTVHAMVGLELQLCCCVAVGATLTEKHLQALHRMPLINPLVTPFPGKFKLCCS